MPCFYPVKAFQHAVDGGSLVFAWDANGGVPVDHREVTVRCGQCFGCRLDRSKMWAIRCMHEKQMHPVSTYATFTYSDKNVPVDGSLNYFHFSDFMKRLRQARFRAFKVDFPSARMKDVPKVRYFAAGEYGDESWRPHFHALLFGIHFPDQKYYKKNENGDNLYESEALNELWGHGQCLVGEVTFKSAAYIARYVMKKVTGAIADEHYTRMTQYGEIVRLEPEMLHMSLRPGIGATWFAKYKADIYNTDSVVVDGRKHAAPRYYDVLLQRLSEELLPSEAGAFEFDDVKEGRKLKPVNWEDQTEPRLRVREAVLRAKMSSFGRKL